MRTIALLIVFAFLVAAVAASDRSKPLIVDAHPSGQWAFNNAADEGIRDDAHIWLQICDPIHPLKPPTNLERPKKVQQV